VLGERSEAERDIRRPVVRERAHRRVHERVRRAVRRVAPARPLLHEPAAACRHRRADQEAHDLAVALGHEHAAVAEIVEQVGLDEEAERR
jgi:hypothetical protein